MILTYFTYLLIVTIQSVLFAHTFDRYHHHHQLYPTTSSLYRHRFGVPCSSIPAPQQQQQHQSFAAPGASSSTLLTDADYSRQRAVINGPIITTSTADDAPETASTGPFLPYRSV